MAERRASASDPAPASVDLPELVQCHVERSLPGDAAVPRQVRIVQEGQMWQKAGGRAMRFTAGQRFAVDRVAFSWRARIPASAEVYWELDSGRFVYWRGRVTGAELLEEPFQR